MALCAFNGCCIDLLAFKMFHRQAAICLGWMGDLSALINKLLGAPRCKQGVAKRRITGSSRKRAMWRALLRLRIGLGNASDLDAARIKHRSVLKFDAWFTLGAHMGALL